MLTCYPCFGWAGKPSQGLVVKLSNSRERDREREREREKVDNERLFGLETFFWVFGLKSEAFMLKIVSRLSCWKLGSLLHYFSFTLINNFFMLKNPSS